MSLKQRTVSSISHSGNNSLVIRKALSNKIRRLLWIITFCKEEPSLRKFCFWAEGCGAICHPGIFARADDSATTSDGKGMNYGVYTDRYIQKGTTLMSIPLSTGKGYKSKNHGDPLFSGEEPLTHNFGEGHNEDLAWEERSCIMQSRVYSTPVASQHFKEDSSFYTLVEKVCRGLYDNSNHYRKYLEFLHDAHNSEGYEGDLASSLSELGLDVDLHSEDDPLVMSQGLSVTALKHRLFTQQLEELDDLTMGNSLVIQGVHNGPFISVEELSTPRARNAAHKIRESARQMTQGLPHFATNAVNWAHSMVMSRAIVLDSIPSSQTLANPCLLFPPPPFSSHINAYSVQPTAIPVCSITQDLALIPLMDMCNHALENPSAHWCISCPDMRGRNISGIGVKGWRKARPNIHLVAVRNIEKYEEVTIKYSDSEYGSDKKTNTDVTREMWKIRYGIDHPMEGKSTPTIAELTKSIREMFSS